MSGTAKAEAVEDAYCAERARRYLGTAGSHTVADYELELWLKAERAVAREEAEARIAVVRALLLHVQENLEAVVAKLEAAVRSPQG